MDRLRALLLAGDDADRDLARGTLTDSRPNTIARRRGKNGDTAEHAVRRADTRRLALAVRDASHELTENKQQLIDTPPPWVSGVGFFGISRQDSPDCRDRRIAACADTRRQRTQQKYGVRRGNGAALLDVDDPGPRKPLRFRYRHRPQSESKHVRF